MNNEISCRMYFFLSNCFCPISNERDKQKQKKGFKFHIRTIKRKKYCARRLENLSTYKEVSLLYKTCWFDYSATNGLE